MDIKEIEKLALLSRLEISSEQATQIGKQITDIMQYFQQIQKINTSEVEPLATPVDLEVFWREDVVEKETTPEEILANAPERVGNLFKVPPVV